MLADLSTFLLSDKKKKSVFLTAFLTLLASDPTLNYCTYFPISRALGRCWAFDSPSSVRCGGVSLGIVHRFLSLLPCFFYLGVWVGMGIGLLFTSIIPVPFYGRQRIG